MNVVTFVKDATCLTNKKGNRQLKLRAGVSTLCPGHGSPLLFLDRVLTGHDCAFLNDCHHPVTKTLRPIKTEVLLPDPSQKRSADSLIQRKRLLKVRFGSTEAAI